MTQAVRNSKYTLTSYLNTVIHCINSYINEEIASMLHSKALVGTTADENGIKKLDLDKFSKFTA